MNHFFVNERIKIVKTDEHINIYINPLGFYSTLNYTQKTQKAEGTYKFKCPKCQEPKNFKMSDHKWCESDINPSNICGICYENPVNVSLPKCMHTFCSTCIPKIK
jgi:hypothetical protein